MVLALALDMGARDEGVLEQLDHFYRVPKGRLKLRVEGGKGTLIAYTRKDNPEARESEYFTLATDTPDSLQALLDMALIKGATLRKRRHLLQLRHTRIHIDEVEGLGKFVELETVLDERDDWDSELEHEQLVVGLNLGKYGRIAVAYADLLEE